MNQGLEMCMTKSIRKGVDFLVAKKVLDDTPGSICNFLRLHRGKLDEVAIGDYLGEGLD